MLLLFFIFSGRFGPENLNVFFRAGPGRAETWSRRAGPGREISARDQLYFGVSKRSLNLTFKNLYKISNPNRIHEISFIKALLNEYQINCDNVIKSSLSSFRILSTIPFIINNGF